MSDHSGEVFGLYRLIQKLGAGGFAQVYKGEHTLLSGVYVAIKILISDDPTKIISLEEKESFLREARAIGRLDNPHVIRFKQFDFRQPDAIPFIVMDYLPNGSLRDKHPQGSTVLVKQVVTYVEQIAEGLQHAHNHKIVHRDIKPENILFNQTGEIVVSDFGIAVEEHSLQSVQLHPQDVAGTFAYTAPEQFAKKATARSDQYALAIMVYEMLMGRTPFVVPIGSGDTHQIARQYAFEHIRIDVPPMLGVPKEIAAVILKALSKNPNDRYSTITDFSIAFDQAVANSTTMLQPPVSPYPAGSSLPPTVYPVKPNVQPVLPPTVPAVPPVKKLVAPPIVQKAQPAPKKHKVKNVPPSPQGVPKVQMQQRQVFQIPRRHNPHISVGERLVIFAVILFFLSVPVSIVTTIVQQHKELPTQKVSVSPKHPTKKILTPTLVASPTQTASVLFIARSANEAYRDNIRYSFSNIDVPESGKYQMILDYEIEKNTTCEISINDGKNQMVELPSTLDSKGGVNPSEIAVIVQLEKGDNTITIYSPTNLQYVNEGWLGAIVITQ